MMYPGRLGAASGDTTADRVLGQADFTTNAPGVGANGLSGPSAVAIDRSTTPNRLYIADSGTNRVLGWKDASGFANGAPADIVIGQPDFSSIFCVNPATSSGLCLPTGVAVDDKGNLYVADFVNNRVLEFDSPFSTDAVADRVFGQPNFSSRLCSAASATSLCEPVGVAVDSVGNLYVADTFYHRVLEYDGPLSDQTADRVFGQADFTSLPFCNRLTQPSAGTLCHPTDLALDPKDNLYVLDTGNNRVLEYNNPLTNDTTADRVFGQPDFSSTGCNNGGISASSLCFDFANAHAGGITTDLDGNLYIADTTNNRGLEYDSPLASDSVADGVFGQSGSFTTNVCGNGVFGSINADSLCSPRGIATDIGGDFYVADGGNNRVLEYDAPIVVPNPPAPVSSNFGPPSGSNVQATAIEPVSTGNGNYYYTHTDVVVPGGGLPLVFARNYNALDSYTGPLGEGWTHTYNIILSADATHAVIRWGDGHGETYDFNGTGYVPQPGVFKTLVKNGDGTYTLTLKNQTRYDFNAGGILSSITDRNGNHVLLSYGVSGNLTTVTDAVGRSLSFTYDANNRISGVTDPAGRSISFSYDANNNLVQAIDPAGGVTAYTYDASHHVTSITLPNGQLLLQNVFDGQGRAVSQTNGRGLTTTFAYDTPSTDETTITDPLGNHAVHTYDSTLRVTQLADAVGGTVSYAYDANNDRTSVTNQNGKTNIFTYDTEGNLTEIIDPLGDSSSFTYDANNDLLSATNPRGGTTSFSYDATGNLTDIQDALGDSTTLAYDGHGELVSKQDARGNATTFAYDASGDLAGITDALGDKTGLGYDAIGRLVSVTDANGHTATAAYDTLSRLTSISDPLGDGTQFAYDAIGNLLGITDANSHSTQYAYDAVDNLLSVSDALGHVTHYAYDGNNNRVSFTNAKGAVTSYGYDALNRLARTTDPLGFVRSYVYDNVGNVTATTDPNGGTNQFAYNALNHLVGIAYADGNNVAYTYDPDGNRTAMTDSHGTSTYAYDALDRLATVSSPEGAVSYAYDPTGNRKSLTYPDAKVVNYSYDPANRLALVKDWRGWKTGYIYDAADNLRHITYPNSAAIAFKYDPANRLVKVVNRYTGTTSPISHFIYTLDPTGNRLQVTNGLGVATSYVYDALNELIKVKKKDHVTRFTYDAVGNRLTLSAPESSVAYSYDADDRLLTAGPSTFTYDRNGNRITKTMGATTLSYSYDAANRLISADGGGGTSIFSYDGDGNRIARNGFGYVNDVAGALTEVLQENQVGGLVTYVRGLGLISESGPGFNRFYQYDALGSVVGLTNRTGVLAERYNYDAWGNPAPIPLDPIGRKDRFRFTREALDPGTGLYYLRARYYDTNVGRLLTRDPFSGFVAVPATANQYAYTQNNPVNYVDPTGFSILWAQTVLGLTRAIGGYSKAFEAGAILAVSGNLSLSVTVLGFGTFDAVAGLMEFESGLFGRELNIPTPLGILASDAHFSRTGVEGANDLYTALSLLLPLQGGAGSNLPQVVQILKAVALEANIVHYGIDLYKTVPVTTEGSSNACRIP